jgi:hypothetical protein
MTDNLTVIADSQQAVSKEKRVTTRKIGKCTYIVSSSFKEGKERDAAAAIARLIQNENPIKPGA